MQAVILAGGRGSRLDPYTRVLPKSLLPIGQEPLAGILIRQLQRAGVTEVIMCLGYLAELMVAYFQDGDRFGVPIRYVLEKHPLGTAGPLRSIEGLNGPFLVVNGDEFTTLNFQDLYRHHQAWQADMTIAVQEKSTTSVYGVLELSNGIITSYSEKPSFKSWVSMGIYVLNVEVLDLIPDDQRFDMPELVQILLARGKRVIGYESQDLWFDIGNPEDLEKARRTAAVLDR